MRRWLSISALAFQCVTSEAWAASDSWATANSSDTVCVAPMDNASWSLASGTDFAWIPSDLSTGCADANNAGAVLEVVGMSGVNPLVRDDSSSNATMFAALPSGHSLTYVWRSPISSASGSVGSDFMGTKLGSAATGRIGLRFYRYYSSDYTFTNDPGGALCNSVKIIQGGYVGAGSGGPMIQAGEFTVYDVSTGTGWSSNVSIPDPAWGQSGIPSKSSMRGKWFRYELYISNNTTSGTSVIQAYGKNITDGTAEFTIIDTTGQAAMSGVHPNPALTDLHINGFRSNNGDPCNGYHANTHLVIAAWSSDTGQRIGGATEVEGGGGSSGTITMFLRDLIPFVTITDAFLLAYLWQRRSQAVTAALTIWRYAAYPKAWWWTYRYTRAVKRWQAEAPVMLEYRPSTVELTQPSKQEHV